MTLFYVKCFKCWYICEYVYKVKTLTNISWVELFKINKLFSNDYVFNINYYNYNIIRHWHLRLSQNDKNIVRMLFV
jgi:hypothetical protein